MAERATTTAVRRVFAAAAGLVFAIGLILFVLSGQTDRFFAWTIKVPLTAAFLGALYLASGLAEVGAVRSPVWASARTTAPGVLVFAVLTLLVTVVHRDAFHFGAANPATARLVAWVWLLVYAAFPVAMGVALLGQRRARGVDPPRRYPLIGWTRAVLAGQAALMLATGLALLVVPDRAAHWWPWPLTTLTAQAIGAWGVGIGAGVALAVWENDWLRLRVGAPMYVALGVLGFAALARYPHAVGWDRPSAWVLVLLLTSLLGCGGYAALHLRRVR